jgi:hypothetical protein
MDNEWFTPHSSQVTLKSHTARKWNRLWSTTGSIPQMKQVEQAMKNYLVNNLKVHIPGVKKQY